jgi:threonine dehydrogenase-like Zn-dependent dehydrogenase
MSSRRVVRSLGIAAPWQLAFFDLEEAPPPERGFRVDTLCTGLSTGTELSWLKGTNPYLTGRWDERLQVFDVGEPLVTYPIRSLGYMEVGVVTASRATAPAEGDLVAMAYGHKTGHTAGPADRFVALPDGLDPVLGTFVAHMGPICANGLLHAAAEAAGRDVHDLGDGVRDRLVLVMGGGVVGLLVGLLARHHGAAEVVVADPTPERRSAAEALGLAALDTEGGADWRAVKERWRHGPADCGADVAFQCRGRAAALASALRALRPQGTVIDLAFYQDGAADVRFGEEFHHNGLGVRCAQIRRVPRGLADRWDRRRLSLETIELLRAHGDAIRRHLVTDVVPLEEEAPALVEAIARRRRHALQAVFTVGAPHQPRAGYPDRSSTRSYRSR